MGTQPTSQGTGHCRLRKNRGSDTPGERVRAEAGGYQTEDDFIRSCIPDFAKPAFGISMQNGPTCKPFESAEDVVDEFNQYMADGISFSQMRLTQLAAAAQASQTSSVGQRQINMATHYNELRSAFDEDTLHDYRAEEEEQSSSRSGFLSPPPAVPAPPAGIHAAVEAANCRSPTGKPIFAVPNMPASGGSASDNGMASGQNAAAVMWASTTPRNTNAPALHGLAAPQSVGPMQSGHQDPAILVAVLSEVVPTSEAKESTATPPSAHGGQRCPPLHGLSQNDHASISIASGVATHPVVARVTNRTDPLNPKKTVSKITETVSTATPPSGIAAPSDAAISLASVRKSISEPVTDVIDVSSTIAGAPSSCFDPSSSPCSSPTSFARITRRHEAASTPPSSTLPSSSPPRGVSNKPTTAISHAAPVAKPSRSEHLPQSVTSATSLPPVSDAIQEEGPRVTTAQAGSVLISSLKIHAKFIEFLAEEAESHTIADLIEAGMTSRDMASIVEACAKEHNIRIIPRTIAGNRLREALEVYESARESGM